LIFRFQIIPIRHFVIRFQLTGFYHLCNYKFLNTSIFNFHILYRCAQRLLNLCFNCTLVCTSFIVIKVYHRKIAFARCILYKIHSFILFKTQILYIHTTKRLAHFKKIWYNKCVGAVKNPRLRLAIGDFFVFRNRTPHPSLSAPPSPAGEGNCRSLFAN